MNVAKGVANDPVAGTSTDSQLVAGATVGDAGVGTDDNVAATVNDIGPRAEPEGSVGTTKCLPERPTSDSSAGATAKVVVHGAVTHDHVADSAKEAVKRPTTHRHVATAG